MAVVIITNDDTKFLQGKYIICYDNLDVIPDQPDVTYILRTKTTNEQQVLNGLNYLQNRLVICVEKMPRLSKLKDHDQIIFDEVKVKSHDFANSTRALLKENDRLRAYHRASQVPIPYALSFIRSNVTDIEFHRRLATIGLELDDMYCHGLFAYGIKPLAGRISWPNNKAKSKSEPTSNFRTSDVYWEQLISLDVGVGNQVRKQGEVLPKGVKKSIQHESRWL